MKKQSVEISSPPEIPDSVKNILNALTDQEKVLIVCARELYEGSWDAITYDLMERLEGRPYIFKLGERIREDIERVKHLREVEDKTGIHLSDFVKIS